MIAKLNMKYILIVIVVKINFVFLQILFSYHIAYWCCLKEFENDGRHWLYEILNLYIFLQCDLNDLKFVFLGLFTLILLYIVSERV
jgi:hypothetical protein